MTVDEVIELANLSLQSRALSNELEPHSPLSAEAVELLFEEPACETLPLKDGDANAASTTATASANADKVITSDVETIAKHMSAKSAEATQKKGLEMLMRGLKSPGLRATVARKFVTENNGTQLLLSVICSTRQLTVPASTLLIGALKSLTYLALPESGVSRQVRADVGRSKFFAAMKGLFALCRLSTAPPALQRTLNSTAVQAITALCEKNPGNCKALLDVGLLDVLCDVLSANLKECAESGSFDEHFVMMVSVLRFFEFFSSFGGASCVLAALPLPGMLVRLAGEDKGTMPPILRAEVEKAISALSKVSVELQEIIKKEALKLNEPEAVLKFVKDSVPQKDMFCPIQAHPKT